jgi:hypothetical protein
MRQLDVADNVYEQVMLLARAWETSVGDVIHRLLIEFRDDADNPAESPKESPGQVALHAIYGETRTEALYDPVTKSVTITTGPLAGRTFSKPSGAAVALVQVQSPGVNPNRNGWSFWVMSETGERLQAIRYNRPGSVK